MKRGHQLSGFTIVELLIVIVVIGILAAITIVAYNGIQDRARNAQRVSDVNTIQKALEQYKALNGTYPATSAFTTATLQAMCSGVATGYGYSFATDGTWLKPVIDQGIISRAPVSPINDCTHYYRYLHPSATSYGCTTRTSGYYILQVVGVSGGSAPDNAVQGTFKPCPEATAGGWGTSTTTWTFEKDDD